MAVHSFQRTPDDEQGGASSPAPPSPSDTGEDSGEPRPTRGGGPRTAAGSRAVSKCATTHGINSLNPVAGGERTGEWEPHYGGFREYFDPCAIPEKGIVLDLALTMWR
jgi:hypothetical protein